MGPSIEFIINWINHAVESNMWVFEQVYPLRPGNAYLVVELDYDYLNNGLSPSEPNFYLNWYWIIINTILSRDIGNSLTIKSFI